MMIRQFRKQASEHYAFGRDGWRKYYRCTVQMKTLFGWLDVKEFDDDEKEYAELLADELMENLKV